MANCTKFLEAQKRHAKKSHPKCRRRGKSPRIPKAVGPKTQYAILRQVVTLIPPEIVHDIDRDVRHRYKAFSVWSHIVALIYQQLTRTEPLNGVCDAAKIHESEWGQLRDATVPHRNTLSNANRKRDPALAEKLYWELLKHFSETFPDFSKAKYTADDGLVRRVTAKVVVQGKWKEMVFFTNNFDWTPRTIAELYKARWAVELFFKEFKQTCQVRDFIGYNERAVKWQVWIGLLVHLLLRFVKFGSKWELSFSRLAGVVRCAVWVRRELFAVLALMGRKRGTAGAGKRTDPSPRPLISQGFLDFPPQNMGQQAA